MNKNQKIFLIAILLFGFCLRIFNINWDSGYIFHPDERAIIMAAVDLRYPSSLSEFISPESPLNTNFFAYGNFPIYLLKASGDLMSLLDPNLATYNGIHVVGRLINSLASTLTILIIFLFAKRLFNYRTAILAAIFYAVAVFPIQNSHFFTVDTLLTLFILLTLYFLDFYIQKPSFFKAMILGASFGLALASKISAAPVATIIIVGFIIARMNEKKRISFLMLTRRTSHSFIFLISTIILFFLTQPYTLIDFKNFSEQILLQSKMGTDPFIFPYTLQYVGKIPILYEFKNIFFWGLGVPLSILAFSGLLLITIKIIFNFRKSNRVLPIVVFFWLYFLLSSSYAVGWMRYLLPVYPALTLFAAFFTINYLLPFATKYLHINKTRRTKYFLASIIVLFASSWTIIFMSIYLKPHTKIVASEWISQNIPAGKTLATEHWDDQLPIFNTSNYQYETLALYEHDTKSKWETINRQIENSDYIIIASNRLYTPLRKLTDCKNLPENRCYRRTAKYYDDLFSEKLNFTKVVEFTSYPSIPLTNLGIDDQSADESFTVYDHPKIIIYKSK